MTNYHAFLNIVGGNFLYTLRGVSRKINVTGQKRCQSVEKYIVLISKILRRSRYYTGIVANLVLLLSLLNTYLSTVVVGRFCCVFYKEKEQQFGMEMPARLGMDRLSKQRYPRFRCIE